MFSQSLGYISQIYTLPAMIFYIMILLCIFAIVIHYRILGPKKRIPYGLKEIPTESGLPIIGVLNKVGDSICNYLVKLNKKHGPIYRVKFGMREIVVLNTFQYIKSAMVDHGDTFSGRWKLYKFVIVSENAGIGTLDGDIWAKQRSFVLRTLRDFGVGRARSMEIVQDECISFLKDLDKMNGKILDFSKFIPFYTANIISKFIMNKRLSHEDRELHIIEKIMDELTKAKDPVLILSLVLPFLDTNLWLMKFIIWITSRKAVFKDVHEVLQKEIEAHLNKIDFESEGEDLMDRFLIEQQNLKKKNGQVDTFTNLQLVRSALELFSGGYETTSTILVWTMMFMAMYPEIQDKVHKEIIETIGNERLPTMSDKASLNYTQAVMDEIFRLSSIVPNGLFHRTLNDVSVNGYFIPKDTLIIPNLFACHLDPNIWENPLKFHPEHFLIKEDSGKIKYKAREELIQFGLGKRQCLGESLARMEYFIFFTCIMQRFQVRLPNYLSDEINFDVFNTNEGLIRVCRIKEFIFQRQYK